MQLSNKQIKFLKAKAHHKKVVVTIGAKGFTKTVKEELDLALSKHELIKIKLPADDKPAKQALLATISKPLKAANIALIGRVGILYRPANNPIITLPK